MGTAVLNYNFNQKEDQMTLEEYVVLFCIIGIVVGIGLAIIPAFMGKQEEDGKE